MNDYSTYSDAALRDETSRLRACGTSGGGTLDMVFGVVDEAVGRRLGAWRLFERGFDDPALDRYREAARAAVDAGPYRSSVGYYTDDAFLDGPGFRRALRPLLETMGLDPTDGRIVEGMVYVAERRKVRHESHILLPSEFYRAVSSRLSEAVGFRATAEQLRAGRLLCDRNIVEMNAGEGKTVAAAFPAVLHAVLGRRVHVITGNDYLASRDAAWLGPVYESLGLTVAALLGHMGDADRAEVYRADVVYGTLRELGFDLLRDSLRDAHGKPVQGRLDVAIVDEADQALIDEAGTPLIIGGGPAGRPRSNLRARAVIEGLVRRQADVARGLEREIARDGVDGPGRRRLLARLLLADPESAVLHRQLAEDRRLVRRLRALTDPDLMDESDNPLTRGLYYTVSPESETVTLTELGQEHVEAGLGRGFGAGDLERKAAEVERDPEMPLARRRRYLDHLHIRMSRRQGRMNQAHQMLRAYTLFHRDVHYVVTGGRVVLVDELTGRRRPDNRYQFGLQAALEAKEGLAVNPETEVLAQISVQGFIRRYEHVSGMTGTALESEEEFRRAYRLAVVPVSPTNGDRRVDLPTMLFRVRGDKLASLVEQTELCRRVGRPVLIGTLTVEQSDEVSGLLDESGIGHRRLDAVNNAEEAAVVRAAGSHGAVTVATNMAGRGTDILVEPGLDGRVAAGYAALSHEELSAGAGTVVLRCGSEDEAAVIEAALSRRGGLAWTRRGSGGAVEVAVSRAGTRPGDGVVAEVECGLGLYVIGTELNDSRRVDLQLRGRSGRQGGFGSSRFILSCEDRFLAFSDAGRSVPRGTARRTASGLPYYRGRRVQAWVDRVQAAVEVEGEAGRSAARDFDLVMESRDEAYGRLRRRVLGSESFHARCLGFVRERSRRLVESHFPSSMIDRYPALFRGFAEELWEDFRVDASALWELGIERTKMELPRLMAARLDEVRVAAGRAGFDEAAKHLFLKTGDDLRVEHLAALRELLLSVRLCGHGHKAAVAEFMERTVEAEERFWSELIAAFLPRLYALEPERATAPAVGPAVLEDVREILV